MAKKKVAILGAGISGLSLGYFLKKFHKDTIDISIFESAPRTGGWIKSSTHSDFIFEHGPRSIRAKNGSETFALAKELNLLDQMVWSQKSANKRYILWQEQLEKVPPSINNFFLSSFGRKFLWAIAKEPFANAIDNDLSVSDFFQKKFNHDFGQYLADALVSGIYAGDAKKLSLQSSLPSIFKIAHENGSFVRSNLSKLFSTKQTICKSGLFSFKNGLETLTQTLSQELSHYLNLRHEVKKINYQQNLEIFFQNQTLSFDHVFSTLPAQSLAKIIDVHELKFLLQQIPTVSLAVVNLLFEKPVLKHLGFGYLLPRSSRHKNLGVIFDSQVFARKNSTNHTQLCVMLKSEPFNNFNNVCEQEIIESAKKCLNDQLKISEPSIYATLTLAKNAIPQYHLGHEQLVKKIEEKQKQNLPHLTILGNSFYGVAVNDCVKKSQQIAKDFNA